MQICAVAEKIQIVKKCEVKIISYVNIKFEELPF